MLYCTVLTSAPRAVLGLVAFLTLCLGLVGVAPGAVARVAEVATTTSVVLTAPRPEAVNAAITVTAADGTAANGVVEVVIRSVDGSYDESYGLFDIGGDTFRSNFSVPGPGAYELEARYTASNSTSATTYAPSVGTDTATVSDPTYALNVRADDIGNGVLEASASLSTNGQGSVSGGSFVFRLAGRDPVTVRNAGNASYAHFERLALDRSYTVTVTFEPAAGSDLPRSTGEATARLTARRHTTFIGGVLTTPRRGVVRVAAFMIEDYPKGLTGRVAVRDRKTGKVVARIDTMRYVNPQPGIVRTITGVSPGPRYYQLQFTPAPRFRAIAKSAVSRAYKVVVR